MDIKTKYNIGDTVYFQDYQCAGFVLKKATVFKISIVVTGSSIVTDYLVATNADSYTMAEWQLFATTAEFKESIITRLEEGLIGIEKSEDG